MLNEMSSARRVATGSANHLGQQTERAWMRLSTDRTHSTPARAFFIVLLLLVTTLCAVFPQYGGWDVAAYMAIVRPDHSHDAVYDELQKSLPQSFYADLIGRSEPPLPDLPKVLGVRQVEK